LSIFPYREEKPTLPEERNDEGRVEEKEGMKREKEAAGFNNGLIDLPSFSENGQVVPRMWGEAREGKGRKKERKRGACDDRLFSWNGSLMRGGEGREEGGKRKGAGEGLPIFLYKIEEKEGAGLALFFFGPFEERKRRKKGKSDLRR